METKVFMEPQLRRIWFFTTPQRNVGCSCPFLHWCPQESRWIWNLLAMRLESWAEGQGSTEWDREQAAPHQLLRPPILTTPATPRGKRLEGEGCTWFLQSSSQISTLWNISFYWECFWGDVNKHCGITDGTLSFAVAS